MKKALTAILAILYMTIASGVEMNIHYCMGELASVELGKAADKACSKCGMEAKDGCCEDESRIVKVEDSHQASVLSWPVVSPAIVTVSFLNVAASNVFGSARLLLPPADGPPVCQEVAVYLRNCVFRI